MITSLCVKLKLLLRSETPGAKVNLKDDGGYWMNISSHGIFIIRTKRRLELIYKFKQIATHHRIMSQPSHLLVVLNIYFKIHINCIYKYIYLII